MLSIVIAARDAVHDIGPCLATLEPQLDADADVLVVDASVDGTADYVEQAHPLATLLRCAPGSGLAELRAAGLCRSRGDVVAFTDPYCRIPAGWLATLRAEPWDRYAAVGGVVDAVPRQRPAEWAAFLNEYAAHLPEQTRREVDILPGNNIGFRREALERAGLIGQQEFWKTFALWRLAALGERFWVDPDLIVLHDRATDAAAFAYHRYLNGRCFGANRVAGQGWGQRLARAATCPWLPFVLTARLVWAVQRHPRYRRALWQSLPMGLWFHVAWAMGELHGYLCGRGDACARLA